MKEENEEPDGEETSPDDFRGLATILIIGAILLGGYFAVVQLRRTKSNDVLGQQATDVLVVNTVVAQSETSVDELRTYTGVVKAGRSADLSFDRGGRVTQLLVSEGDVVNIGQPLAQLDLRRLELEKESLTSALASAKSELARLAPDAPVQTVPQMQAKLRQLRGELNQLEGELANRLRVGANTNNQAFVDRLNAVEQQLNQMGGESRRQKIESHRQRIAELEGQLKDLDLELESGRLTAPFNGVVAIRHISDGAVVSPGMPVLKLVAQTSLKVWVGIPVDLATRIGIGELVKVTIGEQDFETTVEAKLPQLDQTTRTRSIILKLGRSAIDRVLVGQVARVQLRTKSSSGGVWLPYTALNRESQGLWSVFVAEGELSSQVVGQRYVELVHLEKDRALVRGTLSDGELVIANGVHRVVPGQRVRSQRLSEVESAAMSDASKDASR